MSLRILLFPLLIILVSCQVAPSDRTGPRPGAPVTSPAVRLSPSDAERVGRRIWKNESGGKISGLTAWNKNEAFASLGIGHFIWYPQGIRKTYEESFPSLLAHLQRSGVRLPQWLTTASPCPWPNRQAFEAERNGVQMRELRQMLANTIPQQTEFLIGRLQRALPKMLGAVSPQARGGVDRHFNVLASTKNGAYALIDYVNFKGEGTNPKERYRGLGWGLLQVLEGMQGMPTGQAAVQEFSNSAKRTLGRRIQNAPKPESQWRKGWFRRVEEYAQPW